MPKLKCSQRISDHKLCCKLCCQHQEKNEATTEISLTSIVRHSIRTEGQQTCKALFKNFTQICDALQSSDTLSPHFWVFLGCKRIHNLVTNAHYNELHLTIQLIQKRFVLTACTRDRYLSEPVHCVKQSTANNFSICLIQQSNFVSQFLLTTNQWTPWKRNAQRK